MMRSATILLLVTIVMTRAPARCDAAIRHVPAQFPTIQAAVDACSTSGDSILVASGDFPEDVIVDGKALHVIGAGAAQVTSVASFTWRNPPESWAGLDSLTVRGSVTADSLRGTFGIRGCTVLGTSRFTLIAMGNAVLLAGCDFRGEVRADGRHRNEGMSVTACRFTDADCVFDVDGATVDGSEFAGGDILVESAEGIRITSNVLTAGSGITVRQSSSLNGYIRHNRLTDAGSITARVGTPTFIEQNVLLRSGGISLDAPWFAPFSSVSMNVLRDCSGGISVPASEDSGIRGNTLVNCGAGIAIGYGDRITVAGNTIVGGAATGLSTTEGGADGPVIEHNLVVGNASGIAPAPGTMSSRLSCNDAWDNPGGNWVGIADPTGTNGNISADPLFCDRPGGDLTLRDSSPCAPDSSCGLIGGQPVGCGSAYFLVKADGSGDLPTIQAAVDAARDGTVIELADGTFTGNGNRDIDFRGRAIVLRSRGGDPVACVMDCAGAPGAPHRAFRFSHQEGDDAEVANITITRGHAQGPSPDDHGGAVLCIAGSSPTIRGCIFRDNSAVNSGGAIMARRSLPVIRECAFDGNSALHGGGVYFYDADSAGVDTSAVYLDRCTFRGNQAAWLGGGVVIDRSAASTVSACTFHGNAAPFGGGIHLRASSSRIAGSIIAGSTAGRAVSCDSSVAASQATLACSDIHGNTGGDWVGCIAGQESVRGNLALDPLFCGPYAGDLHLDGASPCLDAAGCGLVGALGQGCDGTRTTVAAAAGPAPGALVLDPATPNPFRPATQIRFGIPETAGRCVVRLAVYDAAGRLVRVLAEDMRGPGHHGVTWDGAGDDGRILASGVYFCRLTADGHTATRRLVLAR